MEDRVKWWADLVEVPCIGYAGEAGEVGRWRKPAPISSRLVIGYGRTRKEQPRR